MFSTLLLIVLLSSVLLSLTFAQNPICDQDTFYTMTTGSGASMWLVEGPTPVFYTTITVSDGGGTTLVEAFYGAAVDPTNGEIYAIYQLTNSDDPRRLGKLTKDYGSTAVVEDIGETFKYAAIAFLCNGYVYEICCNIPGLIMRLSISLTHKLAYLLLSLSIPPVN